MEFILENPTTWVAVAFIIFMAGFVKLALPFILRSLDTRSATIQDELNEAVRLREEAQTMLAEYQQKQHEMLAEAEQLLRHAEEEAKSLKQHAQEELQDALERRKQTALDKIARSESDAIAQLQSNISELAIAAAQSIIVQHLEDESGEELIDLAAQDVERIIH